MSRRLTAANGVLRANRGETPGLVRSGGKAYAGHGEQLGPPFDALDDRRERRPIAVRLGLAEQVSDISLACRQIGPIKFKHKLEQGDDMFRQRRSLFFKKMQIVRGCDAKRNVLVYMVYSDKLIEGSPKNSTSSVPVMPWGADDTTVQKCGEFIQ